MRVRSSLLHRLLVAVVFFAAFVRCEFAQDCRINTFVRVIDKTGQPLVSITAAEIRAGINGNPVNISSFSPGKPDIILILDISPSIKRTWNQSLAAARQLVGKAEKIDTVIFREKVQGYAIGRAKSEQLLDQLSNQGPPSGLGGTALYDTLVDVAGRVTGHNTALVLISDGGDNLSYHSARATASLFLHSSWPPVFALILDYDEKRIGQREYLKEISAATGGMIIYPSSAANVSSATEELATIVLSPFVMTLQTHQSKADRAKLKLEAVEPDGKRMKHISLFYAAEVPACDGQRPERH